MHNVDKNTDMDLDVDIVAKFCRRSRSSGKRMKRAHEKRS